MKDKDTLPFYLSRICQILSFLFYFNSFDCNLLGSLELQLLSLATITGPNSFLNVSLPFLQPYFSGEREQRSNSLCLFRARITETKNNKDTRHLSFCFTKIEWLDVCLCVCLGPPQVNKETRERITPMEIQSDIWLVSRADECLFFHFLLFNFSLSLSLSSVFHFVITDETRPDRFEFTLFPSLCATFASPFAIYKSNPRLEM